MNTHRQRFADVAIYKDTAVAIGTVYYHLFSMQSPRQGIYLGWLAETWMQASAELKGVVCETGPSIIVSFR